METQTNLTGYRKLRDWQKGMDLAEECYNIIQTFPPQERFSMSQQIWRSSYSIPSNIAEGYSRGSRKEYVQFLWISHGSLRELQTHLILCGRVGLLSSGKAELLLNQCDEIGKMLHGLIQKMTEKTRSPIPGTRNPDL